MMTSRMLLNKALRVTANPNKKLTLTSIAAVLPKLNYWRHATAERRVMRVKSRRLRASIHEHVKARALYLGLESAATI